MSAHSSSGRKKNPPKAILRSANINAQRANVTDSTNWHNTQSRRSMSYLPTVPIWSGQSRYNNLNPMSHPLALESPVCLAISEHSNCHTHFVYDACARTTQALQSEAGLSGPRVRENPEIDSKVRRLARVCGMAEGGRRRKTVAHGDDPSPETKRRKRECQFFSSWTSTYDGIGKSHRGTTYARCSYCACGIDINISHGGKKDVEKHVGTSGHGAAVRASKGSANLSSFFAPESSQEGIETET